MVQSTNGLYAFSRNNLWGFINSNGNEIVTPTFTNVGDFHEGIARVMQEGKYGYINEMGQVIIPIIYDSAENFSDGMAAVKLRDIYYYLDNQGTEQLALALDKMSIPERIMVQINQNKMTYNNGKLVTVSLK